jgi:hypothetical protein
MKFFKALRRFYSPPARISWQDWGEFLLGCFFLGLAVWLIVAGILFR